MSIAAISRDFGSMERGIALEYKVQQAAGCGYRGVCVRAGVCARTRGVRTAQERAVDGGGLHCARDGASRTSCVTGGVASGPYGQGLGRGPTEATRPGHDQCCLAGNAQIHPSSS